jgi:hypothetical protein
VDTKLQLVGQYQYQGASDDVGVRVNSRYGRADDISNINSGHDAKLQGGIEYQTMDTPDGDFDSLTYVIAFRSFF